MTSTFWTDGYRDAQAGSPYSPPGFSVYCAEYQRGYNAFFESENAAVKARDAALRAAAAFRDGSSLG